MTSKPKSSKWGSLLSGAVAGIESRLDTILTDEKDASAKSRLADANASAASQKGVQAQAASKTDVIDAQPRGSSESLRSAPDSSRPSLRDRLVRSENRSRASSLAPRAKPVSDPHQSTTVLAASLGDDDNEGTSSADVPSFVHVPASADDLDAHQDDDSSPGSDGIVKIANDDQLATKLALLESQLALSRQQQAADAKVVQEELHVHLERIDALQAKLQYLAKDSLAAATAANASAERGSHEQALAQKDERIALLIEEGERLGKKEMRNLATIKRLSSKNIQDEKNYSDLRTKLTALEKKEAAMRSKTLRLDVVEKDNAELKRQHIASAADIDTLRSDANASKAIVSSLRQALQEADDKLNAVESDRSSQAQDRISLQRCQEQLKVAESNLKTARDEASTDMTRQQSLFDSEKSSAHALELELRAEIQNLEARNEALRSKAEEASSDVAGDSQAKLLRQIETLQTQYGLAASNWRTIEGSLNSRVVAIQSERDEIAGQETDLRKKARDATTRNRTLEDEQEKLSEDLKSARENIEQQRQVEASIRVQLTKLESSLEQTKLDHARQRQEWEVETASKIEEERRRSPATISPFARQRYSSTTHSRKASNIDPTSTLPARGSMTRMMSNDSAASLTPDRAYSHRPSLVAAIPNTLSWRGTIDCSSPDSPSTSRQGSFMNLSGLPAPSTPPIIEPPERALDAVDAEDFERAKSGSAGRGTVNDVLSMSTVHAGPSVQLVERMSSSIRRLEAEKAAQEDEVTRVAAQRDEARDQVVALMREAQTRASEAVAGLTEASETNEKRVNGFGEQVDKQPSQAQSSSKDLDELKRRYHASLEMIGEREEECADLKADIVELKRIYRELAAQMGRS